MERKAFRLVVHTSLSGNSESSPCTQQDCVGHPYSDTKLEHGFFAHYAFGSDSVLYFTDVSGRKREQAVLKTTLKATTSEAEDAEAHSFEMLRALTCLWRSAEGKVAKRLMGGFYHPVG